MHTLLELLSFYKLQQHPEGGYYKESYRSNELISLATLPSRFMGERSFSTAIYFLLEAEQFSAFHRIKSDEMWHFYAGEPLNIYVIDPEGTLEKIRLGSNFVGGETYQAVVQAGCWFASMPANKNSYSFVGCTVAPGFDFDDFELAERDALVSAFPQHATLIRKPSANPGHLLNFLPILWKQFCHVTCGIKVHAF